jgi:hypothetical protein
MKLAWGCAGLAFALLVIGMTFTALDLARIPFDQAIGNFGFTPVVASFAIVGALIASRRPGNSVGWICLAIALLFALVVAADAFTTWGLQTGSLADAPSAWLGVLTLLWVPALGLMATELPLRLPDGRPLTRGWSNYGRLTRSVVVLATLAMLLQPGDPSETGTGPANPIGVAAADALGPVFLLIPVLALGAIASLFVRYRHASLRKRQQLAWIAFGGGVFIGLYLAMLVLLVGFGIDDTSPLGNVLTSVVQVAFAAIPVAIGIAVLRHRLYDINVVINRALVYAGLTATLAAAYLATVLVLQLALAPLTNGNGLAVAASTLAVAALFRPARGRIQRAVDRRFFRDKYDAVRTLEAFSAHLRDQVDLDALSHDLRAVVDRTMQPAHVSLWLRPTRR